MMMKGISIIISIILILVVGIIVVYQNVSKILAQRPQTPPQAQGLSGTIKGKVEMLGDPTTTKAGVKVFLASSNLFALTNNDGNYTIDNVPVGILYTIIAYNVGSTQPQGTGQDWLKQAGDPNMRYGVYIPSAGATVVLPTLHVDGAEMFEGAP